MNHLGRCLTPVACDRKRLLRKTRTTGVVPCEERGAETWETIQSVPRLLIVLPTLGISTAPVGSSSTSRNTAFPLYS